MVTVKWKGVFEILSIVFFNYICKLFIDNKALDTTKYP